MFTLGIFNEVRAGTPAYSNVAGKADQHLHITGDDFFVPNGINHLLAVMVGSTTATSGGITQAKLYTPSHNSINLASFEDTGTTAWEPGTPLGINDLSRHNIYLTSGEAINLQTINSGTNNETTTGIVFLGNGRYVPAQGEIITKRFTAAITCVAYTWVGGGALTFEEGLEAGQYAIVGMKCKGASLLAARLVGLTGVGQARPGCVGVDTLKDIDYSLFRHGNLGVWGSFVHSTPPTLEVFAVTTDTAQEGYLDLVKIG